jgi:3-oxoacyl-[acyl-carrier-protein] synthase-3
MKARISGIGQWVPEEVRTNDAWPAEFMDRARRSDRRELVEIDARQFCLADRIAQRYFEQERNDVFLGTKRRRIAPSEMTAPEAEARAARAALDDAGRSPSEVDVVVSWAAVPERIVPPSAPKVAHSIGAERAYAVGLDAACATPIAQLEMAAALIESGRARTVLLTQSHLITRTFSLLHPASPNVGDIATALLVEASERPGILTTHAVTHGEYYSAVTWCRGKESDPPWWEAGPAYYLGSQARNQAEELVRTSVRIGAQTVKELLDRSHAGVDAIDLLVSVQPRRWFPRAIVESLEIDVPAPDTFDEFAHLGGCGLVSNLLAARDSGKLNSGTQSVLYAQGAGFTRAAALVRW